MKKLLKIILLIIIFPSIATGQTLLKVENNNLLELEKENRQQYITKSDLFLKEQIGNYYFKKYFNFHRMSRYSLYEAQIEPLYNVDDQSASRIILSYILKIPEIKYYEMVDVIYSKHSRTCQFKDTTAIPNFILHNSIRDIIDTSAIKNLLISKGVTETKIELNSCSYDGKFNRFIWTVFERLGDRQVYSPPYNGRKDITWCCPDSTNVKERSFLRPYGNKYTLDACSGQILKVEKSISY